MFNSPKYWHFANTAPAIKGFCQSCQKEHHLLPGRSAIQATILLQQLMTVKSIDIFRPDILPTQHLALAPLFGESRGKMFGILHYKKRADNVKVCSKSTGFLYAFSGQYNGVWHVDGWVPPPFSIYDFQKINVNIEKKIKQLTIEIATEKSEHQKCALRKERKKLSRELNKKLQNLCILHNFKGEKILLSELFSHKGIPTGTGECCTPKLLNFAAKNKLQPLGLCEFFIGRATKSQSCQHAHFYPPCTAKCSPLLGFMLCGIDGGL